MKTNKVKSAMDERVEAICWSETNTKNVLQKIREEGQLTKKKIPTALSAAIILLLILVVTALAESKWGLMQWFSGNDTTEAISSAKPETVQQAECPQATFQLTEAASDGYGLYIDVLCIPKESQILLLNASVDPNETTIGEIGIDSDDSQKTVGIWAAENGYTSLYQVLLYSGHWLNYENLEHSNPASFDSSVNSTMHINNNGSCNILISGSDIGPYHEYELSCWCVPYTRSANNTWEIEPAQPDQYTTLRFTVPEEKRQQSRIIASYYPSEEPTGEYLKIERTDIVSSGLSTYIVIKYTLTEKGRANANCFNPPIFYLSQPEALAADHLIKDRAMHGRAEISIDNQITYQYYYSCTLPEELPDEISISAFSSAREMTDDSLLYDSFSYEETGLSEETKMVRSTDSYK